MALASRKAVCAAMKTAIPATISPGRTSVKAAVEIQASAVSSARICLRFPFAVRESSQKWRDQPGHEQCAGNGHRPIGCGLGTASGDRV